MSGLRESTPYSVSPKGIIFVQCGGELEDKGQIDGLNDPDRNLYSIAYPPAGKTWRLLFECDGETKEIAMGTVGAPDVDKKSAVEIRTRVRQDANVPKVPE